MLNINDIHTREVGTSEFIDSKSRIHKVKHSIIFTEVEKCEQEEQIVEDFYRIFEDHAKSV